MIFLRLAGGLGNQIFQLGAGLLFSEKVNCRKMLIDASALGNYDAKRENELLKFFDFSRSDINIEFNHKCFTKFRIPKILPFIFNNYPFVSDKNFQKVLKNPNKSFILLDGYFQECLTQENFNEEIAILKNIFMQKEIGKYDGCVIHIRGGDFVKLGWNSITPKEYYINAMKKMVKDYNIEKFYIVTDDKKYASSILNDLDFSYEFIGSSMQDDFYLIGNFKYRILSSSTFALWASALGDNENSVVIAPEFWTPNVKRKILLPHEIRI